MTFFEPSPTLIALIFVKRFVFFEVLILLALLRGLFGRGPSRIVALLCFTLCGVAILTTVAPALDITSRDWYRPAAQALAMGQGMAIPLALSALFLVSALLHERRLWLLDWLNGALVLGVLGLWIASQF